MTLKEILTGKVAVKLFPKDGDFPAFSSLRNKENLYTDNYDDNPMANNNAIYYVLNNKGKNRCFNKKFNPDGYQIITFDELKERSK